MIEKNIKSPGRVLRFALGVVCLGAALRPTWHGAGSLFMLACSALCFAQAAAGM